jgi:MFS transporter, DHA3 family, macrolide efflux protein
MNLNERFSIFKSKSFLLYFSASTVSYFGTGMQFVANSWVALKMTESNMSVAIMLVATIIPGIVLLPFIGVAVDRRDRKKLCSAADMFRAIMIAVIPLLGMLGLLKIWHLYLAVFLVALGDQVYNASIIPLIREVIDKDKLLLANSTAAIGNQTGALVGAGVSGVIVAFFSPYTAMLINAGTFLISSICIMYIRRSAPVYESAGDRKASVAAKLKEDMLTAAGYIRKNAHIVVYYLIILLFIATLRTINILLPAFSTRVLQVGAEGFGYIDAAFALGAICGNFFLPYFKSAAKKELAMKTGVVLMAGALMAFGAANSLFTAIFFYFLIGLFFQARIMYLTRIQQTVDPAYMGRVHALFNSCFYMVSMVVYLSMGYFADIVGIRYLYVTQGGLVLAISVLSFMLISSKSFGLKWRRQNV